MKHTYLLGSLFIFVFSCSSDEANNVAPGADSSSDGGTGAQGTGGRGTGGRGTDGGTPDGSSDSGVDGSNTVQLTVTISGTAAGKVRVTGGSVDRSLTGTTV